MASFKLYLQTVKSDCQSSRCHRGFLNRPGQHFFVIKEAATPGSVGNILYYSHNLSQPMQPVVGSLHECQLLLICFSSRGHKKSGALANKCSLEKTSMGCTDTFSVLLIPRAKKVVVSYSSAQISLSYSDR